MAGVPPVRTAARVGRGGQLRAGAVPQARRRAWRAAVGRGPGDRALPVRRHAECGYAAELAAGYAAHGNALPAMLPLRLPHAEPGAASAVAVAMPGEHPTALVVESIGGQLPSTVLLQHVAVGGALELARLTDAQERQRRLGADLLARLLDRRIDPQAAQLAAGGARTGPGRLRPARRPGRPRESLPGTRGTAAPARGPRTARPAAPRRHHAHRRACWRWTALAAYLAALIGPTATPAVPPSSGARLGVSDRIMAASRVADAVAGGPLGPGGRHRKRPAARPLRGRVDDLPPRTPVRRRSWYPASWPR